jgi:hypothetical protein
MVTMLNRIYDLYVHDRTAQVRMPADLVNLRPIREAKTDAERIQALESAGNSLGKGGLITARTDTFKGVCRRDLQNEISAEKAFDETEAVLASAPQSQIAGA